MIKDLLNYVEGKLMIESRTSTKIYLSNGNVYNDKVFNQQAAIVRSMLVYFANSNNPIDDESVLMEEAITIRLKAIKNVKERILNRLKSTTKSQIILGLNWVFPYGCNKGKVIGDIVKTNPRYVEWFINHVISLDSIFELYQDETYPAFLKEKELANLKTKNNDATRS